MLAASLLLSSACEGEETPQASGDSAGADPAAETKAAANAVDPEKQAAAKKARDAIAAAPVPMQGKLAAAAMAEVDAASLPPSLLEGLEALTNAPPDMQATLLAKSLSENMELLDEVCGTDARALMQSLAGMAPAERDHALWKACSLERHGLLEASDRPTSDPMLALFAHMIFIHAGKQRTLSEDERALLKLMMAKVDPTP